MACGVEAALARSWKREFSAQGVSPLAWNVVLALSGLNSAPAFAIGAKPTTIKASGVSLLQLLVFSGTSQNDVICTYNTQD